MNENELNSIESLDVQIGPDSVASLTLNRPSRKNALDHQLVLGLGEALLFLGRSPEVRVIVLRGAGGAFCSGADLESISNPDPQEIPRRIDEFHRLILAIVSTDKPVLASIDGPAVGFGADLALACDLRIFSENAYLEEGFVKIGLMPDGGGTHWMRKYAGARAFEFLALGSRLDAVDCLKLGLASSITSPEKLETETTSLAMRLAKSAPLALAEIKKSLRAYDREELEKALAREKSGQSALVQSSDFHEGLLAFREKRKPSFRGH